LVVLVSVGTVGIVAVGTVTAVDADVVVDVDVMVIAGVVADADVVANAGVLVIADVVVDAGVVVAVCTSSPIVEAASEVDSNCGPVTMRPAMSPAGIPGRSTLLAKVGFR